MGKIVLRDGSMSVRFYLPLNIKEKMGRDTEMETARKQAVIGRILRFIKFYKMKSISGICCRKEISGDAGKQENKEKRRMGCCGGNTGTNY